MNRSPSFIVKVCGLTTLDDARCAVDFGANALGFNFYPKSPRYIEPEKAAEIIAQLPAGILNVGVVVGQPSRLSSESSRGEEKSDSTVGQPSWLSSESSRGEEKSDSTVGQPSRLSSGFLSSGFLSSGFLSSGFLSSGFLPPGSSDARDKLEACPTHGLEARVTLDAFQVHGLKSEAGLEAITERIIIATSPADATRFPNYEIIIDTSWGTGELADWEAVKRLDRKYILSGGLTPDNVAEAIQRLHPAGVDVCSGVESSPGRKDHAKLKRFLNEVSAGLGFGG